MDNPHELDPSVERRLAGQHRLNIVRLDAYLGQGIGAEGMPMLRISTGSGSSASCTYGISLAELVAGCEAFNAAIVAGAQASDFDPAAERRQRGMLADAIGDRVRQMAFDAMAPRVPAAVDVMTDRDPMRLASRARYIGSDQHQQDEAGREAIPADREVVA